MEKIAKILSVVDPTVEQQPAMQRAAWLAKVRHNWRSLGPFVTARRMVAEYDERLYRPERS